MKNVSTIVLCVALCCCVGCPGIVLPGGSSSTLDTTLRALLAVQNVEAVAKPSVDTAKATLGQALFFDKILSGNRNISCSTCHTPLAFTGDGLSLSIGQGGTGLSASRSAPVDGSGNPIFIPRNAPEVFNRADFVTMFWDARVTNNGDGTFASPAGAQLLSGLDNALAAQAMFPVTSDAEMRGDPGDNELADLAANDLTGIWSALMDRLVADNDYVTLFAAAYPGVASSSLTFAHAANAIAEFEIDHWTLTDSPFDNYLRGDDEAMSLSAKRGALLFYGQAGCSTCHAGTLMTDESFHNRACPQIGPGKGDGTDGFSDFGRERVSGDAADRYKFRTPPLRNVSVTGPWMHDGVLTTLADVVRHELDPLTSVTSYDTSVLTSDLAAVYRPEQLTAIIDAANASDTAPSGLAITLTDSEVNDLVTFLESLTSPSVGDLSRNDTPESVPSGLPLAD